MNGWEFAAELITKAYWPAVVGTAIVVLRKPLRGLIGRIREASGPGFGVKADPEQAERADRALARTVQEAAEPGEVVREIERQGTQPSAHSAATLREQDAAERRVDIERVAKQAAEWGQTMARLMPNPDGTFWEPVLDWQDDGTVRLTFGKRRGGSPDDFVWGPSASRTDGDLPQVRGPGHRRAR